MTQRQRDQSVITSDIQIEFQLFAPGTAVAHQGTARGTGPHIPVVQCIMEFAQSIQAFTQHGLIRPIAGVGTVQQRHMSRLTHQGRQSDHAQIPSFALGVAAARQFSWCGGCDMRVKVRRVERQHIRRQLEAPDDGASDVDLCLLQMCIRHLGGKPVKRLPGKRGSWQTRHARNTRFQKGGQMAFGPWRTGSLHRYGEHHLANRRTAARRLQTTGLIDEFDQVQLLSDPHQSAHVANQSGPDGTRQSQISHRGRICRAQHGLSSEGPLLSGIPQRLGSNPITPTSRPTLEDVHSFI